MIVIITKKRRKRREERREGERGEREERGGMVIKMIDDTCHIPIPHITYTHFIFGWGRVCRR